MGRLFLSLVIFFSVSMERYASADSAVSIVFGTNVGGNLELLSGQSLDIGTSFKNSPMYGVRAGSYGFPFGLEASVVYVPSRLMGGLFEELLPTKTSSLYSEANLLLIMIPGPIAPFVTTGLGVHYLDFKFAELASLAKPKLGWNFGGGLKVDVKRLMFRLDVRDHVTAFGFSDLGLGALGNLLSTSAPESRVHNVELSISVGIKF